MQFAHLIVDISEHTFQDNDLFLRSMHEHVLRTHFQVLLLHCESRFFSKMVKFGPNNRIKTTSISFTTVHFIFLSVVLKLNNFANQSQGRGHEVHNF